MCGGSRRRVRPVFKRLLPLVLSSLIVVHILPTSERFTIVAEPCSAVATCSSCGRVSRSIHSRYERFLGDLPWQGRPASLHILARRLRCLVQVCPRQTFLLQLPLLPNCGRAARRSFARAQASALRESSTPPSAGVSISRTAAVLDASRSTGRDWLRLGHAPLWRMPRHGGALAAHAARLWRELVTAGYTERVSGVRAWGRRAAQDGASCG